MVILALRGRDSHSRFRSASLVGLPGRGSLSKRSASSSTTSVGSALASSSCVSTESMTCLTASAVASSDPMNAASTT